MLPIQWFLLSLVLYFFALPLFGLIMHDWICHEFCEPKNSALTVLMLLFFYTHDNNVKNKKNYHVLHHRTWNTPEQDPTYRKLQGRTFWQYLLALHNNLDLGIPNRDWNRIEHTKLVQWLDRHSRSVYWFYMLTMFLIVPWPWFVTICVFYQWITYCMLCYHDYHLHGPVRRPDHSWAQIVFGQGTWHQAHHENWQVEYYGPGLWRWFNPAWYYRHWFFKSNTINQ